jgi:hypothetical protein
MRIVLVFAGSWTVFVLVVVIRRVTVTGRDGRASAAASLQSLVLVRDAQHAKGAQRESQQDSREQH